MKRLCKKCCCKNNEIEKKYTSVFVFERKYAALLTTAFCAFTFGFAMPMLFAIATICFVL